MGEFESDDDVVGVGRLEVEALPVEAQRAIEVGGGQADDDGSGSHASTVARDRTPSQGPGVIGPGPGVVDRVEGCLLPFRPSGSPSATPFSRSRSS
ncbi:Uncharacterised protein [Mycobacteroides abscessus subsp. abscessus]|nr:Uncharacterised protein [Mycobacteroides abscessus subsp. abscessus]